MNEHTIKIYWYYFKSIANQLQRTEEYVDHSINSDGNLVNAETNSYEFAKILMLASSEFEVISKALCNESGISLSWNANIVSITKSITRAYPRIGETRISTPYQILQPLKEWNVVLEKNKNGELVERVLGIDWWDSNNKIKHNRGNAYLKANLKNCIDAIASLMVMELYLSQRVLNSVDKITSLGCNYFSCNYGAANLLVSLGNHLPDYESILYEN